MTIYAAPGGSFTPYVSNAPTASTIGYRLYDPATGTDVVARFTTGIVETPSSSGAYYAPAQTAPLTQGTYQMIWDSPASPPDASEDLIVTWSALPGSPLYLTAAALKATLTMTTTTFADADITLAIGAASRAVDTMCGRRFWLDADATKVRYYTPKNCRWVQIDDLAALTSVTIDRTGTGSFSETWVQGTDFVLEPFNAPAEQPVRPYEQIRVRRYSGQYLPEFVEQSVKVTGQFGWSAVPDDVTAATGIIAAKLLLRSRQAPFGIVQAGIDGAAMRIAYADPDVRTLLRNYDRTVVIV